jgi:hypothetical protein
MCCSLSSACLPRECDANGMLLSQISTPLTCGRPGSPTIDVILGNIAICVFRYVLVSWSSARSQQIVGGGLLQAPAKRPQENPMQNARMYCTALYMHATSYLRSRCIGSLPASNTRRNACKGRHLIVRSSFCWTPKNAKTIRHDRSRRYGGRRSDFHMIRRAIHVCRLGVSSSLIAGKTR